MACARGTIVLGAMGFVRERHGPEAHDRVMAALPPGVAATLLTDLREAAWKPVDSLVAYMETARRLLAPHDPAFFRDLGRFAGQAHRSQTSFAAMVASPVLAMRMGPKFWSAMWDTGRLQVTIVGEREGIARIHDFQTTRSLCERTLGAWEGLLSTDALDAHAEETACALRGDPGCEVHVTWVPRVGGRP
ncbi:MAG TPA: hypothetical protein VFM29_04080 [Vicinamibacteria bacterium]|nr:hypothetical protein [Vicinamibacteria bacterium]